MPSEVTKILALKRYWKSDKTLSVIYADLESLIKKMDGCKNNSQKSSATKVGEDIPCRYCVHYIDI